MPRDPAPTRAAILQAAAERLELGGPDAVTLRSIGAAAGVSRSAPYRHFADKPALLMALAAANLQDLADRIRDAAAREDGRTALHRGCAAYVQHAIEHPRHYLLVFGDAPVTDPTPELEAAADAGFHALEELVVAAQSVGDLPEGPPREQATVVWVTLHGMAQLQITGHLHEPRTLDGGARLDDLLSLALTSMRPR